MKWTLDRQLFAGLALLCFLFNLLINEDQTWLWLGAESQLAYDILEGRTRHPLSGLLALFSADNPFQTLNFRLPGKLITVLGLVLIAWMNRRLLNPNMQLLFLLSLGTSFWLPGLARLASGDVWLLVWHSVGVLGLINFLKKPGWIWRGVSYAAILLSIWWDPLSGILLFLLLPTLYYLFHRNGKRLWRLNPWLAVVLSLLLVYLGGGRLDWLGQYQYFGWGTAIFPKYLALLLLAFLPQLGFLVAGIYGGSRNLRRREEFALFFLAWLLVAILVQSASAGVAIAYLVARHVNDYFIKNYPYGSIIKGVSVLHLIGFFFLAAFVILGGFFAFRGAGFRAGVAFAGVYWMLSFILVIGVYSQRRRLLYSGLFLTGLLSSTLFFSRVSPLLESERLPRKLEAELSERRQPFQGVSYDLSWPEQRDNVPLYLNRYAQEKAVPDADVPVLQIEEAPPTDTMAVRGWRDNLAPATIRIRKVP